MRFAELTLAALFCTMPVSAHAGQPVGLTTEWRSAGSDIEINHVRFPGGTNEREWYLFISRKSPKELAFMPGNLDRLPDWMEVEWQYGIAEASTYAAAHRNARPAKTRVDLKALIPPAYIEEVARDRNRKQLKLIATFTDSRLEVRAEVYQWRR